MDMRLCECGCGEEAGFYASDGKGHREGQPKRFVNGHNGRFAGRPFTPLEKRYTVEDRGHTTPCWVWQMTLSRKGYGMMWDPGRNRLTSAARYYYERFVRTIPEGLQIDHLCRVRACVNPAHLEPVTQAVNQQRGANAKLTREQADEIRRRGRSFPPRPRKRDSGHSLAALSREFGVSKPVIEGIISGRLWP